jgi:predicted nucleotidyltransferase
MAAEPEETSFALIEHALKRTVAALREAEVPFLLGGSLASWARGGPETRHDLDLMIKESDVDRALKALEDAGMRTERPPEDWLVKAWDGEVLVDLIHHAKGLDITDEVIARGEVLSILSMDVPVMALEDVMTTKLLALTEHRLNFDSLLRISRALREQIDWEAVRERTADSPFARAFFVLLEGLEILPAAAAAPPPGQTRVRVLTSPGAARPGAG